MEISEEMKAKIEELKEITQKEVSLSTLVEKLELNEYEILGLVNQIRTEGITISVIKKDDDIYLYNQGEKEFVTDETHKLNTDESREFKFIVISDTLIGSKYEQPTILEDIYQKGHEMGYDNVIHCGNLTAGLYSLDNIYSDSCYLNDTMLQVDQIINTYPHIEGMKTYFIGGPIDEKHLRQKQKINVGKRISEARKDMIFLGYNSCEINIDKVKLFVMCSKLGKTYTVSYRSQQQVDSFRSEDKPDIFLLGGLLQMEKYFYRDVEVLSVPSVCATSKEMTDKRYQNTVGAWYVTVRTNSKGELESINAQDSVYYITNKNDYAKKRTLINPNGGK